MEKTTNTIQSNAVSEEGKKYEEKLNKQLNEIEEFLNKHKSNEEKTEEEKSKENMKKIAELMIRRNEFMHSNPIDIMIRHKEFMHSNPDDIKLNKPNYYQLPPYGDTMEMMVRIVFNNFKDKPHTFETLEQEIYLFNAIKYIFRFGNKNKSEDLMKAEDYIKRLRSVYKD